MTYTKEIPEVGSSASLRGSEKHVVVPMPFGHVQMPGIRPKTVGKTRQGAVGGVVTLYLIAAGERVHGVGSGWKHYDDRKVRKGYMKRTDGYKFLRN